MKNETFTPERIKAETDAFFEWDGEDRSLVTTTSCLLFAQHIAGLIQDRAAQPAPIVPEGYVLVPVEPTPEMMQAALDKPCFDPLGDLLPWSHITRTSYAAMLEAAAPAQGHQVDHIEQDLGMAQHARDSAELRRLCAERDEAKRQVAALRQHKTDYMEAAEVTRKALEPELSALKAQQVGQEPEPAPKQHPDDAAVDRFAAAMKAKLARSREKGRHGWQNCTAPHLSAMLYDHLYKADPLDVGNFAMMLHQNRQAIELPFEARGRHTAPQPAPAQDVAGLLEWAVDRWHAEVANRPLQNVHRRALDDTWRQVILKLGGDTGLLCGPAHDALAAHDKQSGGEV